MPFRIFLLDMEGSLMMLDMEGSLMILDMEEFTDDFSIACTTTRFLNFFFYLYACQTFLGASHLKVMDVN